MSPRKLAYTLLACAVALAANAQEVLLSPSSYPVPQFGHRPESPKGKGGMALPFFDDFSRPTVFPTPELWEASNVLCGSNYAINPPSIGVATFDAVSRLGELHSWLTTTPQGADTLTSRPINLLYPADDSVYLSFSFQPKGLGVAPSDRDSLALELWDDAQGQWVRAWSASYCENAAALVQRNVLSGKSKTVKTDTLHRSFFCSIIAIDEPRFLTSNFRFRFVGYASIAQNTYVPSIRGNSDHWHIDMVYLNRNRHFEDTVFNDVVFSRPIKNLMLNYTSLPWSHFAAAYGEEFPSPLKINTYYKNLGPVTWLVSTRFTISDLSGAKPDSSFQGGSENIAPFREYPYSRFFDLNFRSAWPDSAKYAFKSVITLFNTKDGSIPAHFLHNDTISRVVEFHNYYSLDDGSAEMGYGLYGEGTVGATVAQKFYTYKADTLRGVMIYFNRTYNDANDKPFRLTVWSDDNGVPGNVIYRKNSVRPKFTDSLNRFSVYGTDPLPIPVGSFYVGWMQETQDALNVGFDLNTNNRSRLFYSMYGSWQNSQKDGTLMLRPILGKMHQVPTSTPANLANQPMAIYPNPARYHISILADSGTELSAVQLISAGGHTVLSQACRNGESIDIQGIPAGFYIVRVCPKKGRCITSKLLIVR